MELSGFSSFEEIFVLPMTITSCIDSDFKVSDSEYCAKL